MADPSVMTALTAHFAALEDPRVERTKLHPLLSVVAIALCAVICGAESGDEIAEFGETKAGWLATFLDLPNGTPAHDTFNRVFAALDPEQFQAGFRRWVRAVATALPAEVIAVDGKTVRGSADRANGKAAIHLVWAWASANRLVLGQVKVDDKSNEISAIPELLRALALGGCLVSIDAIGCPKEIARRIRDQGGDYVLALKDTQPRPLEEARTTFARAREHASVDLVADHARAVTKGHGRLEIRRHAVIADPDILAWLHDEDGWPGLAAPGMVEAERRVGAERTTQARYYLLSRTLNARDFGAAVRSHRGIENQLHWTLDVTFNEDHSRVRAGHAAANFALLRRLALNLLRRHETKRLSIKAKRLKAGWDDAYLLQVLGGL
jgi:predicted transposase YbfD/YdcC